MINATLKTLRALALASCFTITASHAESSDTPESTLWEQYSAAAATSTTPTTRAQNTVHYQTKAARDGVRLKAIDATDVVGLRLLNHANVPVKIVMVCARETLDEVQEMLAIVKSINEEERLQGHDRLRLHLVCESQATFRCLKVTQEDFDKYIEVNQFFFSSDMWMQDWGEIAMVQTANDNEEKLVVFDTNRGRPGLAELPATLAKMWSGYYYKKPMPNLTNCGDYGGNIEVTPDDVLYIGNTASQELLTMLRAGGYADRHALLDTSWLRVGHVDEFMTTVPNGATPRGYSIVKADPLAGLNLLRAIPRERFDAEMRGLVQALYKNHALYPDGAAGAQEEDPSRRMFARLYELHGSLNGYQPEFARSEGCGAEIVQTNEAIGKIIDANIERLKTAVRESTGDTESEFSVISVPALFDPLDVNRQSTALVPGAANLLSLRDHVVVPDPLLPSFRDAIERAFTGIDIKPHFVPDASYHFLHGQLHCGTNVFREPNRFLLKTGHIGPRRRLFDRMAR